MPKITEELRKRWEDYQIHNKQFQERIEAKYHTSQKCHAECRLCGDMVTTVLPDDVFEALKKHEQSHPEYEEWIALGKEFSITDLPALVHDHECVYIKCACICGCQNQICVADLPAEKQNEPMLCDICELYQNRGHVEHRLSKD